VNIHHRFDWSTQLNQKVKTLDRPVFSGAMRFATDVETSSLDVSTSVATRIAPVMEIGFYPTIELVDRYYTARQPIRTALQTTVGYVAF